MNEEIIKILNELLQIPQSTNGEINFYEIESNKFKAIITLIKKQLNDLEKQLEEKDKIINEAIEFIDDYKSYEEVNKQVKTHQFVRAYEDILDEENIAKLLEILERGKNASTN